MTLDTRQELEIRMAVFMVQILRARDEALGILSAGKRLHYAACALFIILAGGGFIPLNPYSLGTLTVGLLFIVFVSVKASKRTYRRWRNNNEVADLVVEELVALEGDHGEILEELLEAVRGKDHEVVLEVVGRAMATPHFSNWSLLQDLTEVDITMRS